MRSICFITDSYPFSENDPHNIFVRRLIRKIAESDIDCWVISPYFQFRKKEEAPPIIWNDFTDSDDRRIRVRYPRFVSYSNKKLPGFNTIRLTEKSFTRTVLKSLKECRLVPDIFYAHFIMPCAMAAHVAAQKTDRPCVFAFGESTLLGVNHYGLSRVQAATNQMQGAIAVSSRNRDMLIENNLISPDKITVLPNGADETVFYPRGRQNSRNMFAVADDAFAVSYVGSFTERKGLPLLLRLMERHRKNMVFLCAGSGPLTPNSDNCLFADSMPPNRVPFLMSASDVFVFPSEDEGCANSVVEALSCGLPVVAWDLPFQRDILNETNAILVPFGDEQAFNEALCRLQDDPALRATLSKGALNSAKQLRLTDRARRIVDWLEELVEEAESARRSRL